MRRPFAILLTLAIGMSISIGITLPLGLFVSEDTAGIVSALVGVAFGTFARDIYRVLRGNWAATG